MRLRAHAASRGASLVLACIGLPTVARATPPPGSTIRIERRPPTEVIRGLDEREPDGQPALPSSSGQAMTGCTFSSGPIFSIRRVVLAETGEGCRVQVEVLGADVVVELRVTTWIAADAPRRLEEHESGHRRICSSVYETASDAAREAAAMLLGRGFEGVGPTCDEAIERAIRDGPRPLFEHRFDYLTADVTRRANAHFDRVTEHGQSNFPPARIALAGSLDLCRREWERRSAPIPRATEGTLATIGFGDPADPLRSLSGRSAAGLRSPPGPLP
jgi:hypothetical protein